MENKKIHYNLPQLRFALVMAQITYLIMGRGTGKTTGPGAKFTEHNVVSMPRSVGVYVNVTYEKLLNILIPGVIEGLAKLGYYPDRDFVIGRFNRAWPFPYRQPLTPKHFIHFRNGSGISLASLDRPAMANGLSADWLYADEARLLDKERLDQVILTIRGNREYFGHLACHGSQLYTTDMPRTPTEEWLLEAGEKMDNDRVRQILLIQQELQPLYLKHQLAEKDRGKKRFANRIAELEGQLNKLRRGLVYFDSARTTDNIHAVGLDYIRNLKQILSDDEFDVSVLNKRRRNIGTRFYPHFSMEKQGYDSSNFSYLDELPLGPQHEKDCRWDADLVPAPLDIACDANAKINWVVTGQPDEYSRTYRVLSGMYVKHPLRIRDCAAQWAKYYEHHPVKEVNFIFDHTFVSESARDDITFADEWTAELTARGWEVNREYIGRTPSHHSRFLFFGRLLQEDEQDQWRIRFNRANCQTLGESIENTNVILKGEFGYQKDKSPERDSSYPQEQAPHGSEAFDTLLWARLRPLLDDSGVEMAGVF